MQGAIANSRIPIAPATSVKQFTAPVSELLTSILKQESTYVLPRALSSVVAPHQFQGKFNFIPPVTPEGNVKCAMIFRPDPDLMFEKSEPSASFSDQPVTINQNVSYKFTVAASQEVTIDADILSPQKIKTSTAKNAGAVHFSQDKKMLVPGFKYYPGIWDLSDITVNDVFELYNPSSFAISVAFRFGLVKNGAVTTYSTSAFTGVQPRTPFSWKYTDLADWATIVNNAADNEGFFISIIFNADYKMSSGFSGYTRVNLGRDVAVEWKNESLWNLLDPESAGSARMQFRLSSRHSVTGFSVRITNTTPMLTRGGSIYAARLPGNYRLDGGLEAITSTITSQVHHVLRSNDLATGANLPWTPEKIQDWMFQEHYEEDPYNGNPTNRPYIVLVMDFAGLAPGSQPTFVISFGMSLEYLTTDISNTFFKSQGVTELLELLMSEVATIEPFSENPDHENHIRSLVSKVVNSDNMRRFAVSAINAGVKLAPFVLSMLA